MNTSVLLIAGMHRSGTSALAGALHAAGLRFGSGLMEATEFNEMGFWEQQEVADLNDQILGRCGVTWRAESEVDLARLGDSGRAWAESRILSLVRRDSEGLGQIAIKDPRLSLTLPVWKSALPGTEFRVRTVAMIRHPAEVASSLLRRDAIPTVDSYLIWLRYHAALVQSASPGELHIVAYDDLLTDPVACYRALAEPLMLPQPPDLDARLASAIAPALRHHKEHTPSDPSERAAMGAAVYYYRLLTEMGPDQAMLMLPSVQVCLPLLEAISNLIPDTQTESNARDRSAQEAVVYAASLAGRLDEAEAYARSLDERASRAESYASSLECELNRSRTRAQELEAQHEELLAAVEAGRRADEALVECRHDLSFAIERVAQLEKRFRLLLPIAPKRRQR